MATATKRLTSDGLAWDIWSRASAEQQPLSVRMSAKQVSFYLDLLRRERRSPPTKQRKYITFGLPVPLEVVVYPNGAGFVQVEAFACEYLHAESRWRIKPEYDGRQEGGAA